MSIDLTKREWKVLRDAQSFTGYYWAQKTCESLLAKGLMRRNGLTRAFVLTDEGRAVIEKADALQAKILASEQFEGK